MVRELHVEFFDDGLGMQGADVVVDRVGPGVGLRESLPGLVHQPVVVAQSLAASDLLVAQVSQPGEVSVHLLRSEPGAAGAEQLRVTLVRAFRVAAIPCVTWERSLEPSVDDGPRSLLQLIRSQIVLGGRTRVHPGAMSVLTPRIGVGTQIVRLRMVYRVHSDVIHHHGIIDLPADAWCSDFVDLSHSLPAAAQVLHFGLWHLLQFSLADVVTSFDAVAR